MKTVFKSLTTFVAGLLLAGSAHAQFASWENSLSPWTDVSGGAYTYTFSNTVGVTAGNYSLACTLTNAAAIPSGNAGWINLIEDASANVRTALTGATNITLDVYPVPGPGATMANVTLALNGSSGGWTQLATQAVTFNKENTITWVLTAAQLTVIANSTGYLNLTIIVQTDGGNGAVYYLDNLKFNAPGTPPQITSQAGGQTVPLGNTATLSVTASGTAPLTYQWNFNNVPMTDANAAMLVLQCVQATDAGNYTCTVSNGAGSATSTPMSLAVGAATQLGTANVTVSPTQVVRTVDNRIFSVNTADWDGSFYGSDQGATTLQLMQAVNMQGFRFPGGSAADSYDWNSATAQGYNLNFDEFAAVAVPLQAKTFITVNYGTGTPQEAAAWVTYSNVTKGYGFKYWEIGNECYGTWETDSQAVEHDPYTYAVRAQQYIAQMKAADPTIKVGMVAVTGEDSYQNNTNHPATNPVTNVVHNGWMPVMLTTMKTLGFVPDFIIYHRYEQNPGQENDAALLQDALTWPQDAANLRLLLNQYLGTATASSIEICCTENNSVNTNPGKQSTSLVNGLYMADSVGNLLQTEINSMIWWDLRNGQDSTQNNSASLFGWRLYGDYGIMSGANDCYPTYYIEKLLSHFARGGDSVVSATSNNLLLSTYAALRQDGTLTLLVLNKSPAKTETVTFSLGGFAPMATASLYTYGVSQDRAAQTGLGNRDIVTGSLTGVASTFSTTFLPYSASVITVYAANASAPTISTQPVGQTVTAGQSVTLTAAATAVSGSPAITYQWQFNGVNIANATGATLAIPNIGTTQAGAYTVVATNLLGSVTSSPATVNVNVSAHLINLSSRSYVGTGAQVLVAGFVVGGNGTKQVLVRADGPVLNSFHITGTLANPLLSLFDNAGNVIATDAGWGNATVPGNSTVAAIISAATTNVFNQVYAFGLPAGSADSAMVAALPSAAYTAEISGTGNSPTGVALAELYDADTGTPTAHLINLSARAFVNTGSGVLVAGFVISGSGSETVLIRGVGPTLGLAPFNLPGALAAPQLTLFDANGAIIATNAGWSTAPAVGPSTIAAGVQTATTTVMNNLYAFSLAPDSADCAMVVTLPAGAYTAQVSGIGGTTGVGLVEVYDVP